MKRILPILLCMVVLGILAGPAGATSQDPYFARQWGLGKVQAQESWGLSRGTGTLVAIVDTGVDLTHPDLQSNILSYPDADLLEPEGDCSGAKTGCVQDGAMDESGHGTHVAGIVAAIANNGTGVAGVAPAAKILPVRILDEEDGGGTAALIAAGIRYAVDHGADVINLSFGFTSGQGEVVSMTGELDPVYQALDYAWAQGSVVVVAAGNDSVPICAEPASGHNVVCVGSTDSRDLISSFSNSDATTLDTYVTAPGGDGLSEAPVEAACSGEIFSTYLRTVRLPFSCSPEAGYEALSGTSMAAPHVSGVAALLAGDALGLSNVQIVECLKTASDDLGAPGRDPVYGYGRVNAFKAVSTCSGI